MAASLEVRLLLFRARALSFAHKSLAKWQWPVRGRRSGGASKERASLRLQARESAWAEEVRRRTEAEAQLTVLTTQARGLFLFYL